MMDDDEFYNYGVPWAIGSVSPMFETKNKKPSKQMSFIGFYENKESIVPYMTNGKRDYKKEGEWDRNHPGREEDRAERHKARAIMTKEGKVSKGDGKDVGHKTALGKGGTNSRGNLEVQSAKANRSFSRNKDGSMKSETSKRESKRK